MMAIIALSLVALSVGVIMVATVTYKHITFIAQLERDGMDVMPPGDTNTSMTGSDLAPHCTATPRVATR